MTACETLFTYQKWIVKHQLVGAGNNFIAEIYIHIHIIYIYIYIYIKKANQDDALEQAWILGNATVTNIFSITHIPRSFNDRIQRTQKYI